MRKLIDHIVDGDSANHQLNIDVLDEPGAGGACHEYAVSWRNIYGTLQEQRVGFQNGPIKQSGINGTTQEALLAILIDRLSSFQAGPYASEDNGYALANLRVALDYLQERTRKRIARGVEGTHEK